MMSSCCTSDPKIEPRSDADYEKQITRMISFIDQETNERVKEMRAKTDEQACLQKANDMVAARQTIDKQYRKMEQMLQLSVARAHSQEITKSRKWVSEVLHDHVSKIKTQTAERLIATTHPGDSYNNLLKMLILQAVFMLNEKQITLLIRKLDDPFVRASLPEITETFREKTGKNLSIKIDPDDFLLPEDIGGVVVMTTSRKMFINNTLKTRLDLIFSKVAPGIRAMIFSNGTRFENGLLYGTLFC